uniref:PAS domain-containing protein n=1 Tax=Trichuris muris TaxID=70415 RepID=A0A5S6QZK2_TRIMR
MLLSVLRLLKRRIWRSCCGYQIFSEHTVYNAMKQPSLVDDIFAQLSPAHCPSNISAGTQGQARTNDTERASSLPGSPLPPATLFSSDLLNDFTASQSPAIIPRSSEMCHSKEPAMAIEEKKTHYFVDLVELLQENLIQADISGLAAQSPNQHVVQEMITQWHRERERNSSAIQHQDVSSTAPGFSASEIGPLLLGALNSFFFVLNSEGLVEFVSDNVSNYLHVGKADFLQKSIFNLIDAADQEHFERLLPDPLGITFFNALPNRSSHNARQSHVFNCRFVVGQNASLDSPTSASSPIAFPKESKQPTGQHWMRVSATQIKYSASYNTADNGFAPYSPPNALSHSCLVCIVRRCEEYELVANHHLSADCDNKAKCAVRPFASTSSLPQKVTFYCSIDGTILAYSESDKVQFIPQEELAEEHMRRKLTDLCADEESRQLLTKHIQEVYENGIGSLSQLRLMHPIFYGKEWLVFGALSRLSSESILSEGYGVTKGDDGPARPMVQLEFNAFLVNKHQDNGSIILKPNARANSDDLQYRSKETSGYGRASISDAFVSFNNVADAVPESMTVKPTKSNFATECGVKLIQRSSGQQIQSSEMVFRREIVNQTMDEASKILKQSNFQANVHAGTPSIHNRCQHAILRHLLNQEIEPSGTNLCASQTTPVISSGLEVLPSSEGNGTGDFSLGSRTFKPMVQHDGYMSGGDQGTVNHVCIPGMASEVSLGKRRSSTLRDKAKPYGIHAISNPSSVVSSVTCKSSCITSEQEKSQCFRQARDNKSLLIKLLEQRPPSTFTLQTSTMDLSSGNQASEHDRLTSNIKLLPNIASSEVVQRGRLAQQTQLQYLENFLRTPSVDVKDPSDAICFHSVDQNIVHMQMGQERDYLNPAPSEVSHEQQYPPLQPIAPAGPSAWCADSNRMHFASDAYSAGPTANKILVSESYLRDRPLSDEMVVRIQDRMGLPFAPDGNCGVAAHQLVPGSALTMPASYTRPIVCSSTTSFALPPSVCGGNRQFEMFGPTTMEKGQPGEVMGCTEKKVTYARKIPLCSSEFVPSGHCFGRTTSSTLIATKESNFNQKFYPSSITIPLDKSENACIRLTGPDELVFMPDQPVQEPYFEVG